MPASLFLRVQQASTIHPGVPHATETKQSQQSMAIVSVVPGLIVTLDVAGQDLAGYKDNEAEQDAPNTTTVFVEAQSGAKSAFAIRFEPATFPHRHEQLVADIYLDGQRI